MDLILRAIRRQLHPHERLQRRHGKFRASLRFSHVGTFDKTIEMDFFAGEQDVNSAPHRAFRAVDEEIDAIDVMVDKSDRFQNGDDLGKIGSANEKIDVLGVPHGLFIDARDPSGHRVAADDDMRNARLFQGGRRSHRPFAHGFHSGDHPFPGKVLQRWHDWLLFFDLIR